MHNKMEKETEMDADIELEQPPVKKSKLDVEASPSSIVEEDINDEPNSENKNDDTISVEESNNEGDSTQEDHTKEKDKISTQDIEKSENPSSSSADPKKETPIIKASPKNKNNTKKKKKRKKSKPLSTAAAASENTKDKQEASVKRKAANLRKNIKDILKTESLGEETLAAQREEAERRERMNLKLQQLKAQAAVAAATISSMPPPELAVATPMNMPILTSCDFSDLLNDGAEMFRVPGDDNEEAGPSPCIDESSFSTSQMLEHVTEAQSSSSGILQQQEEEEIVVLLSSDDDDDETSSRKVTSHSIINQQQQPISELETYLNKRPQYSTTHPYLQNRLPNNNSSSVNYNNYKKSTDQQHIISISSGEEEEEEDCDNEVSKLTLNGNSSHSSPYFMNNNINSGSNSAILTERKVNTCIDSGRGENKTITNNDSDDDCVVVSPTPENDVEKDEKNLDEFNVLDLEGRVLVNVGHPDEDPDIFLAPQVCQIVKPHQIGGIRFLYDNVVESIDRFNTASGFGCILAHSMGLGKTLQAVSFCDVFLRSAKAKTVLIIVPINTIQNWLNEFNVWLPSKKSLEKNKGKSKKNNTNNNNTDTNNTHNNLPPKDSSSSMMSSSLTSQTDALTINETVSLNFDSTLNLLDENDDADDVNNTEKNKKEEKGTKEQQQEELVDQEIESTENVEGEVHLRTFEVYVLNETVKTLSAREKIIQEWNTNGGVMLIGYEMYRMLALKKLKRSKKLPNNTSNFYNGCGDDSNEATSLNNIHMNIVDPGPDLVICDEGHRIKNSGASISQALKAIRTRRRVVLTGYPLQNNLMEYWCMVDFIRPNYLGSKVEFSNMFERPISNGQCVDSTPEDRKLMRFRSHVLHSLLEGFVQRRSHAVLHLALPPKQEWVFLLKMSTVQYKLYKEFMAYLSDNMDGQQSGANPIKAFAVCCKIWNHPDALYNVVRRKQSILDDLDLDEVTGNNSRNNYNNPYYSESSRSRGGGGYGRRGRRGKTSNCREQDEGSPQIAFFDGSGFDFRKSLASTTSSYSLSKSSEALSLDWALPIFENYVPGILENGIKFQILFEIIRESTACGDKLLVFSQTLLSLDLVESFLQQKFNWTKNAQYYRLDGSTTGLEREKLINNFNSLAGIFVFLVSTRAGSLGINLIGANRVVVLDASWNPCHDAQSVCRIYRYGQNKPCHIYRFVSDCTLEKRIYDRQINKRGMSDRVVDEMNPNAQFKSKDVSSFLVLNHDHLDKLQDIKCDLKPEKYSDSILQHVLVQHGDKFTQEPFETESLLIDQKNQRLSATEKRLAHRNYLSEKRSADIQSASGYSYSRPSYAAYYPRGDNNNTSSSTMPSSPSTNIGHHRQRASFLNTSSSHSNFRPLAPMPQEDKFEHHVPALRAKGICVQSIVLKKDSFLADPSGGPDMYLMGGDKIYVLRSEKGTYLRISNGKLIAVRNNPSNSRFPILTVPPSQELAKEQLQSLVYSFLKLPGHSSPSPFNTGFGGSSRSLSSSYSNISHPTEQALPPSASFYSQNKNHLQVTNTRSNSGGDVTMWQPQNYNNNVQSSSSLNHLVRSSHQKNQHNQNNNSEFSKSASLNALLDSSNSSGSFASSSGIGFNSNLEKLSHLARFSGISSSQRTSSNRDRDGESSRRRRTRVMMNDDSSNSNSAFPPPGFLFPHPSLISQQRYGSTPPITNTTTDTDIELIPISGESETATTTAGTSNSQSSVFYSPKVSISTIPRDQLKSNDTSNSSFYEDFTITVKSPNNKHNNSPINNSNNAAGTHFIFDRGEPAAAVDNNTVVESTTLLTSSTSSNVFSGVTDIANFNQYYNNGLVQRKSRSNSSSSSSSNKHEYPNFYPNQGV